MDNASSLPKVSVYPLLGIGVVSGLFAAMFGIGGGVVIVPLLLLLTKLPPRIAAATSLATLLIGTVRYAGSDHIDWVAAVVIGAPAVIGVLLGIHFQKRLPADWLVVGFGVLIIGIGLKLVLQL